MTSLSILQSIRYSDSSKQALNQFYTITHSHTLLADLPLSLSLRKFTYSCIFEHLVGPVFV
ncbi:hypothetical protein [Candidatus Cardinium sp. cByotN1]|uniref:hypothetical protein n=1 Tax=Candidatus Cardinium sp. cByotN1 TaxID=2699439 RepID=UPI001FB2C28F|nr:hypothetical protein [Candidatus Cardinium sp. cByotN1]